ncbi:MAG: hypothetical protein A3B74_02375 [Candidatus Kerfeldbacteria bacterium RIFCSPHIGHO2_02_FULL_42_14]|uniref:DUF5667 domain-containing protein n=1 Tax=Candidatus Kerfeldbacteria bacterium RIFCSPHIGHO2_02_FULL_42_14 TaxID=1798540 RepID=A0A1G2AUE4_9BACT|nr:MAG: hypothetical protein A3B74_02375 [Candidatus Kerfeldbacteria bacterium RIFCSPHIGHO2_02_FULL_42_14]OGY80391.1 MAG: hypothetical protein A3E60_04995 [Candidatus Kerfeldbacteria bacterium RIFCSPHIGHO2_12_FULL_42_13]OGY83820.1 MAG: hypothetical protein A3I91_04520 [Candidatus Kerfeldbacteria bacterium RIFCSPLOWO2_02_FULL_42_19]OGY85406.1 MAG: hypothetical protein A3G01_02345 [Candidatus Kerfeldbacteria bacterium RIFCSPLOWO2_12_FULL_43_9]
MTFPTSNAQKRNSAILASFCFIIFVIAVIPNAKLAAQESEISEEIVNITIPTPKILPGSLLFLVKRGIEKIQEVFKTEPFEKAEFAMQLANRRLEEIEALANLGKIEQITKNFERFQKEMEKTEQLLEILKDQQENITTLKSRMEVLLERHEGITRTLTQTLEGDIVEKITETFGQAKDRFQDMLSAIENFQNQDQ